MRQSCSFFNTAGNCWLMLKNLFKKFASPSIRTLFEQYSNSYSNNDLLKNVLHYILCVLCFLRSFVFVRQQFKITAQAMKTTRKLFELCGTFQLTIVMGFIFQSTLFHDSRCLHSLLLSWKSI